MFNKRSLILLGGSLIFTLFIPACSYWVAAGIQSNFDGQFIKEAQKAEMNLPSDFSITQTCSNSSMVASEPALGPICSELEQFNTLEYWSVIVGLVGLGFILFVLLAGFLSKNNRTLLVTLFKPGLKLSQLTIAFLVLGHGLLMVASIYYFESFWLKRVHFILIGGAGLVAIIAAFNILATLFKNFSSAESRVLGISLGRKQAPKLWNAIDEVSSLAKTSPPDNLIVGMTPNFFVTEAKVRCISGSFSGRTLYLSVPFCRLLNIEELKAIIAHELGHFVGLDTKFSRHFYPIYRGAQNSLNVLSQHGEGEGGLHVFALLPATYLMNFFMDTFEKIESKIGREREIEADKLAGRICGNNNIASSLVKIHAYSNVWSYVESKMLESMNNGQQIVNASSFFEKIATNLDSNFVAKGLGDSHTEHPTDTHPSLNTRLSALGHNLDSDMIKGATQSVSEPAILLFEGSDEIELSLTEIEHDKLSHMHGVAKPKLDEISFDVIFLRSMITMVSADGNISDDELNSLKNIYKTVMAKDLAEDQLKEEILKTENWKEGILSYLERAQPHLKDEGKELIMKALLLLSYADGEMQETEKNVINNIAHRLKIDKDRFAKIYKELFDKAS